MRVSERCPRLIKENAVGRPRAGEIGNEIRGLWEVVRALDERFAGDLILARELDLLFRAINKTTWV